VLWHSQADKVKVQLDFHADRLILTILDDGTGFDFEQRKNGGMGLEFMSERAALIGGELQINSQLGQGTTLILHYPYPMTEI